MTEAGKQTVDDKGRTWTLAEYTVAMWVPTNDLTVAQEFLAGRMTKLMPDLIQNAPEPYVLSSGDPGRDEALVRSLSESLPEPRR